MTSTTQQTLRDAVAPEVEHFEVAGDDGYIIHFAGSQYFCHSTQVEAYQAWAAAHIASIEAERDAAKAKSLPHMCRDEHAEIRHAVSDDDERCPVCRERDDRLAAEAELARLTAALERIATIDTSNGVLLAADKSKLIARTALRQKDADHA